MRSLLACVLMVTIPAAAGDLVARQGNDSVRLTEKPCTNTQVLGHLAQLAPAAATHFQAAAAVFQGQRYEACWLMMGSAAYLVYEDGDQGVVPGADLKPAQDV